MSPARDEIADQYYKTTASRSHSPTREYYQSSAEGLLRRLGPWTPHDRSQSVLDLACGCGELIYALESVGCTAVTGVDLCAEEVENARAFTKATVHCSNAITFLTMQPGGTYDCITAFNFLEHLTKDEVRILMTEANRVLRPGGTLIAMVPNALSPFGTLTRYWDYTHEWAFTPNNFSQLAALTGFTTRIDLRECGPEPHGIRSGVRYAVWQVIRACIAAWLLVEVADAKGGVYTMDMMVRLHKGPTNA